MSNDPLKNPNVKGKLDSGLLKRVFQLLSDRKSLFYLAVIITLLTAVVVPLIPMSIMRMVDEAIANTDKQLLLELGTLVLGLLLLQTILNYSQTYLTNLLGQIAVKTLRMRVFRHVLRYRMKVFDRTPIGTLITRTVSDVEKVADIFAQGLINIIGDLLQMVFIIGAMFYLNWKLTLYVLIPFPLLLLSGWIFKEAVKVSFREVRNQISRLNAFLQEHVTGMQIIQIFSRQKRELNNFKDISGDELKANLKAVLYYSIFFPVIEILSAFSLAALVWFGGKEVLKGNIEAGGLVAFIMFIERLFRPIRQLADKFNTLQMGLVSSERIFRLLDDERFPDDTGEQRPVQIRGEIAFRNVHFAYQDENWILKDVSFEAKQGDTIAIVGHTGAGKTTIVNLINRLYDIQKGSICLDGEDISDYPLEHLREHVAVVLQDVFLFSDTIMNNITLFDERISREQVIDTAKRVGAHEFIMNLPNGYDYQVQERGATLSAGQRQLISFIRALVVDPSILILDEATSSVDNETEELLQKAIDELLRGRTSIVIAHRLSTIQKANKILVMEKGEIKESGDHDELLRKNGLYKKLYELQFAELVA